MTHVPWHPEDFDVAEEVTGIESTEFHSVGIDIGTTTTHLLISRLVARRQGGNYSSEFNITDREVIFKGPIMLTPYINETTIDTERIGEFIKDCYRSAGYTPDDIDTGIVIATGEASRKENADMIVDLFSQRSGKFVCATAGANLEAMMSAHGSGAVDLSLNSDRDILHIDIGGGTTKLAYIQQGIVKETCSVNVGARLIQFSDGGHVCNIERAAQTIATDLGIDISLGEPLPMAARNRLVRGFTDILFEIVDGEMSVLTKSLLVTESAQVVEYETLTFAGGVSEYIDERHSEYYNDLGPDFGEAISERLKEREESVELLDMGIRATAIGSTQHTVQISGNTITITDPSSVPLHNVPMVPMVIDSEDDQSMVTKQVREKLDLYDIQEVIGPFAYGLHLHGRPKSSFLRKVLNALIEGWEYTGGDQPMILAFDSDVALNAGKRIDKKVDCPVIAVDGIDLSEFGYIDIGEPIEYTGAVPVTIKSLIFKG